jgi:glycosyltransferase involved in cell wall biosynthesis
MTNAEPQSIATQRSRVAYVTSWFPVPTETFVLHEMLELRRQGVEVEVFPLFGAAPGPRHAAAAEMLERTRYHRGLSLEVVGAQLYWLVRRPRAYLRAWRRAIAGHRRSPVALAKAIAVLPRAAFIARQIEARAHHHVHAHWATHPALAALVVKELTGATYSFTVHAHDLYVERAMLDEKIAGAAFVATISHYNRALIRDLYGPEAAGKTFIVRCGVDLARFPLRPEPSNPVPTVACIAGLRDYKGQRYLVDACVKLRDRGVPFRCVLVGDGPERAAIAARIAEAEIEDRIQLLGAVPQERVQEILASADVVVHPSVTTPAGMMDGIPVALMEAMATGCPVVSTLVSGIPELVEHERTGLLVPPRDAEALASAIGRLLSDPALRRRLAAAGRHAVVSGFSLDENGRRLLGHFARAGVWIPRARRRGHLERSADRAAASADPEPAAGR